MVDVKVSPVNLRTFMVSGIPFDVLCGIGVRRTYEVLKGNHGIVNLRVNPRPDMRPDTLLSMEVTLAPRASKRKAEAFINEYFAKK